MGQVTVTFTDMDEGDDDLIDIKMEFDPPARKDEKLTPAQAFAMNVLDAAATLMDAEVRHV